MAFDFIDMLVDTKDEYLTGHFYKRRPRTPEDGKITFKYKQLNPNSKIFDTVLGNVRADSARYAIETNDHCGFNIGGYIVTQNGLIWEITEVVTNEQADGSNNVLRWFTTAKNAKCSVRMIRITDLFDKEESYENECVIQATIDGAIDGNITATAKVDNDIETITVADRKFSYTVKKGKAVQFEVVNGEYKNTVFLNSLRTVDSVVNIKVSLKKE